MKNQNWQLRATILSMILSSLMLSAVKGETGAYVPHLSDSLLAHWSFDQVSGNAAIDITGNGYDAQGDAALVTHDGVVGKALECTGSDFKIVALNTQDNFNVQNFTIEAWIYSYVDLINPGSFENYHEIFAFQTYQSGVSEGFNIDVTDAGKLQVSLARTDDIAHWIVCTSPQSLQANRWYHVAGTYDGQALKIYIDGALANKVDYSGGYELPHEDASVACHTRADGVVRNWWNGRLDELKFYNYALSAADISQHFSSVQMAPEPMLIAEWSFDDASGASAADKSGNGLVGNIHGAAWTEGVSGAALRFDGIDDYVDVGSHPLLHGMKAITVDAWVKIAAFSESGTFLSKWGIGSNEDDCYVLRLFGSNWGFSVSGESTEDKASVSSTPLPLHTWTHIAGVYSGDSLFLYENGDRVYAAASMGSPIKEVSQPLWIGAGAGPSDKFAGEIDEVRIFNYALSDAAITARYEATTPVAPSVETLAHWSFDSVSSSALYDVTGNGYNASYTNLSIKDGVVGKALECDGADFEIVVENSANDFNAPFYTIEGWIYSYVDMVNPGSFYNYKKIFDFTGTGPSGSGTSYGYGLQITAEGKLELGMDNANGASPWVWVTANTVMQPRTWYHVAASFDGSQLAIYVNGELEKTFGYSGGYTPWNADARIGCMRMTDGTLRNWFNGKIDELKLYDHALDADSVRAHYLAQKPEQEAPFEINFGLKTVYAQPGDEIWVPIFLTNFEDYAISACQFTLAIDTSVVTYMDFSVDSGLARDWLVMPNAQAGDKIVFGMGGEQQPLSYGEGELVRCLFKVKSPLDAGVYSDLALSDIIIDEDNKLIIPTSTPGKVIIDVVDVLYGDVTGNQAVNIFDAQKILQYVVGALSLPDETVPNFTTAVADVSGNGSITSYDAALVFQHSVGLLPSFPVQQGAAFAKRLAGTESAAFLALVPEAPESDAVTYRLTGENLKGFVAGEFAIGYDPEKINLAVGEIETAIQGATLKAQLDSKERILKVAVTTNDDIDENGEVTLLTITVPAVSPENAGVALSLAKALVNEGAIKTNIIAEGLAEETSVKKSPAEAITNRVAYASDIIKIENHQRTHVTAAIYTIAGRKVLERQFSPNHRVAVLTTRQLPKGFYICRIRMGGALLTRPIVIGQ